LNLQRVLKTFISECSAVSRTLQLIMLNKFIRMKTLKQMVSSFFLSYSLAVPGLIRLNGPSPSTRSPSEFKV